MKSQYVLYFLGGVVLCERPVWAVFRFRIDPSPSFIYSWSISNILLNGLFGQYLWKKINVSFSSLDTFDGASF